MHPTRPTAPLPGSRGLRAPGRVLDTELSGVPMLEPDPIADDVIVPDPDHPGLYRVRLPDGTLLEVLLPDGTLNGMNLTRAKDAARSHGLTQARVDFRPAKAKPERKGPRVIQCLECGKTVETTNYLQKFCNADCKDEYRRRAA
jgi:hypothetical protein